MGDPSLSSDEVRASVETYRELGPEYYDAVVDSFLNKVDKEISSRVDARIGRPSQIIKPSPETPAKTGRQRYVLIGIMCGSVVTGVAPAIGFLADYPPYRLVEITWIIIAAVLISCGIRLIPPRG